MEGEAALSSSCCRRCTDRITHCALPLPGGMSASKLHQDDLGTSVVRLLKQRSQRNIQVGSLGPAM